MNGSIQRLASGATVVITEVFGDTVEAIVVHSTTPSAVVGEFLELDRTAIDGAQRLQLTSATVDMLAYRVPINREIVTA